MAFHEDIGRNRKNCVKNKHHQCRQRSAEHGNKMPERYHQKTIQTDRRCRDPFFPFVPVCQKPEYCPQDELYSRKNDVFYSIIICTLEGKCAEQHEYNELDGKECSGFDERENHIISVPFSGVLKNRLLIRCMHRRQNRCSTCHTSSQVLNRNNTVLSVYLRYSFFISFPELIHICSACKMNAVYCVNKHDVKHCFCKESHD